MPYIAPEVITEAKRMDLLTYLRTYEPGELVRYSGNTYCTREHDSLKISNGKWMWWSRGIGGKSALDYLIKVKGLDFVEAVETIIAAKDFKSEANEDHKNDLIYEVADLWFHTIVVLGYFDLDPQVVLNELARRQGLSGLLEKANRSH